MNETLAEFILSHIENEMDSFQDSLANLMQIALE